MRGAAFDLMDEDPASADAKAVLKWIVTRGEPTFKQSDAIKENRRFRTIGRLETALKVLASRHIVGEPTKKTTGGGRQSCMT
jgi:hypothetical protein